MAQTDMETLYREYGEKVLGYLISRVNDRYLAEDLRSEVFLKICEKIDTFDPQKASVSTWIFTITRNTLTDAYRTRRIHEEIPEDLATESTVEEEVCTAETLDTLADALESLDERERDIIIMRYYSGKTLTEIAEKIGVSYSYIKILHNKALEALKERL